MGKMNLKLVTFVLVFYLSGGVLHADLDEWGVLRLRSLVYPPIAATAQISGRVELRLILDRDGTVIDSEVLSGHAVLAKAAQENAAEWLFQRKEAREDLDKEGEFLLIYEFRFEDDLCPSTSCPTTFWFEAPNRVSVIRKPPHWQP